MDGRGKAAGHGTFEMSAEWTGNSVRDSAGGTLNRCVLLSCLSLNSFLLPLGTYMRLSCQSSCSPRKL